jgi:hypothetical protein
MPLTREDYATLLEEEKQNYRIRESCYKCLRTFNNQRRHYLFDRFDAAMIIHTLMQS